MNQSPKQRRPAHKLSTQQINNMSTHQYELDWAKWVIAYYIQGYEPRHPLEVQRAFAFLKKHETRKA